MPFKSKHSLPFTNDVEIFIEHEYRSDMHNDPVDKDSAFRDVGQQIIYEMVRVKMIKEGICLGKRKPRHCRRQKTPHAQVSTTASPQIHAHHDSPRNNSPPTSSSMKSKYMFKKREKKEES